MVEDSFLKLVIAVGSRYQTSNILVLHTCLGSEDLKGIECRTLTAHRKSDSLISVNSSTQDSSDTKQFVTVSRDKLSPGCIHPLEPDEEEKCRILLSKI
ncbi:hypothetical protein CEXT_471941 [Caerostris extrusa]|uniref:Uncharacterized protein n=1 Tax=Caerostris extrusa TaxID=172846 RepID=A0AAV4MYV4_CAEEX|nr:hypothetical protein CEXT_471941 [Caerostris extrusa]